MPDEHPPPEYQLPICGNRNGHYKQVISYARVLADAFTREVLVKKTWHLSNGYPATNVHKPDGGYKRRFLHQLVHDHYKGPVPPGHEIDHADRDRLNALPSNLRAVTRSVNSANKDKRRDSTSDYKGVSEDKKRGRWIANVRKDGIQMYLGSFRNKHEAARKVNAAYRVHFPAVAIPNPTVEHTCP
jgi:hypothetical protein